MPVQLYVYDMTNGVAAVMSQMLLGQQIEGIWHTAVVVYGREFFFGGQGIQSCMPVSIITQLNFEPNGRHIFHQQNYVNLDAVRSLCISLVPVRVCASACKKTEMSA